MKKILFLFSFLGLSFTGACYALSENPVVQTPPVLNGGILPGPQSEAMKVAPEHGVDYIKDKLIPGVVNGFMVLLLTLSVGMLVLAGYFFLFNSGASETKEKAKNIILWTILAVIIAILAVSLVRLVIGINLTLP